MRQLAKLSITGGSEKQHAYLYSKFKVDGYDLQSILTRLNQWQKKSILDWLKFFSYVGLSTKHQGRRVITWWPLSPLNKWLLNIKEIVKPVSSTDLLDKNQWLFYKYSWHLGKDHVTVWKPRRQSQAMYPWQQALSPTSKYSRSHLRKVHEG